MKALLLLLLLGMTATAVVADRPVHLLEPPDLRENIAAMPQIVDPVDAAERRINAALKHLDVSVLKAARACKGGDWERSADVPMRGPLFLSLTVTDSVFCDGNANPDAATFSIVYDLATGRPVDWMKLLPPSLTGTVALEEQGDGTKIVTLASRRLFALYMAGYGAAKPASQDLAECREALASQGADGPPGMMVWLDAKHGGLAVLVELPHVIAECEDPVVIPASVLRAEGARPGLLQSFFGPGRR